MSLFLHWRLAIPLGLILSATAYAQKPTVDGYQVRVFTTEKNRFQGTLNAIDESFLYISHERPGHRTDDGRIPLSLIRKVVLRQSNKKSVILSGAIVGGLLVGYLSNQSLQRNQTRSPVSYGLTLTFAAVGGAAAGLLLGSAVGTVNRRVIRPLNLAEPEVSLRRQLEPFSVRYQQDFINRLPKNGQ